MKHRFHNRIFALLLAAVLLIGVLPVSARADNVTATRNLEPQWTWPYLSPFIGSETFTFHEAMSVLNQQLIVYLERFRDQQKTDAMEFYYNDNAKILSMKKLEKLAAAYAVRMGMTPQELEQATLTGDALELLRQTYQEMYTVYFRRTEQDMVRDDSTGYTYVMLTCYLRVSDEMPASWGMTAEQQQLYHRYCDEYGDTLKTICYGVSAPSGSTMRQRVVSMALSRVGVTPYYWGDKYDALGIDPRWGFPRMDTEGKVSAYGLDCSGLVSWAFINAAGTTDALQYIGSGTSGQFSRAEIITREEVQIGDLAYRREEYNAGHIGIVVGFDTDGEPLVCNCAQGQGTVITRADDISANCYLRPKEFYDKYDAPVEEAAEEAPTAETQASPITDARDSGTAEANEKTTPRYFPGPLRREAK